MTNEESILLAQQLLDSEFSEANHNPVGYCEAMAWSKSSIGTKRALKKKDMLAPTANDIESLAIIIEGCGTNSTIEIAENNSVADFLCNCIAKNIMS